MPGRLSPCALLLALACCTLSAQAAEPPVILTETQLKAVLASSQPTPLDHLTPYGKRRFLRAIQWREKGMAGFSGTQLVRELNAAQIAEVLAFFDAAEYAKAYSANLAGAPVRLPAPSATLEAQLDRFDQLGREVGEERANSLDVTTTNGTKRLARHYDEVFAAQMDPASLRRQSIGNLPALFDAALRASENDPGSSATQHVLAVHREMVARGINTQRGFDDSTLYVLLSARRFDEAKAFTANRLHLDQRRIPTVVDALGKEFKGRSLYEYDAAKDVLTRRAAPPGGVELLMVVGSGCHFSRDALAALRADPALLKRLHAANVKLMTPPRASIPFWYLAQWNAANPTLPIRVPYNTNEWGLIAEAATPEFFLLKDGKLAGHLRGWPEGGNRAALLALLDGAAP